MIKYREQLSAWNKNDAEESFKELHEDGQIISINLSTKETTKPLFNIKYTKLTKYFICKHCGNRIYGTFALINKQRVHPKSCYWRIKEQNKLKFKKLKG
jgi:hypothetical protein